MLFFSLLSKTHKQWSVRYIFKSRHCLQILQIYIFLYYPYITFVHTTILLEPLLPKITPLDVAVIHLFIYFLIRHFCYWTYEEFLLCQIHFEYFNHYVVIFIICVNISFICNCLAFIVLFKSGISVIRHRKNSF